MSAELFLRLECHCGEVVKEYVGTVQWGRPLPSVSVLPAGWSIANDTPVCPKHRVVWMDAKAPAS